jgi:ComF family protein
VVVECLGGALVGNAAEIEQDGERVPLRQRLSAIARGMSRTVIDQLYPPICPACETASETPDALCAECFAQLRPITAPLCPLLGLPFAVSIGPDALSAEALADPPPFARARSAVRYNDIARTLVSRLKYGDRPELARLLARLMVQAGHEFWAARPVLVPVPLHVRRLIARRYNQSGELAQAIGRITGLSVDTGLLRRHRRTRQQVGLSHDGRVRNVSGAFSAHPQALERLAGRPVVLIDDVYTTGATLKAATRALKRGGADHIDVLSFARVVSGGEMPI